MNFSEIKGQKAVRRVVAGGHNLLMIRPLSSGKSIRAHRIHSIMPNPTLDEFLQILSIQSAAGVTLTDENRCFQKPFRSPHHTISDVGLLGGDAIPEPGEISLAHNSILFMDELPEFNRSALEVMSQPLEDGNIRTSKSVDKINLPSLFMFIAAMNPCPCGYLSDVNRECRCFSTQVQRYRNRISGPLLDRIDIHIDAPTLSLSELRNNAPLESSQEISNRILSAREAQEKRLSNPATPCNARMSHNQIREPCQISKKTRQFFATSYETITFIG